MRSEGDYPTVAVSPEGWEFLRERGTVTLIRPAIDTGASRSRAAVEAKNYDAELFEKLRALRKCLAEERNVPPYVVFSDVSLRHMAVAYPRSEEEFSRMHGVGEVKLEEYGPEFVSAIREYVEANNVEVQTGAELLALAPRSGRENRNGDSRGGSLSGTHETTREMLAQGLSIEQIANERGLAKNTVIGHMERIANQGIRLDLNNVAPKPERLSIIEEAFRESGSAMLGPVKERLGDGFDYDELKLARIHLRQEGKLSDA